MQCVNFIFILSLTMLIQSCNGDEPPNDKSKAPLPGQEFQYRDDRAFQRKLLPIDLDRLFSSDPIPLCDKATADDVLASCPTQLERQQIRNDFNIYFDKGMVDHGMVIPWTCTEGGNESSTMLSMYNTFRLMQCVPFDKNFPWAPAHNNLYAWLKSTQLISIGYFWAQANENSHGWNKKVYLKGNEVSAARYRKVIEPQSGAGLVDAMILLVHEARHASVNIAHNCGYKDSDLTYMGAWAVQHYMDKMLSENTGSFFTSSQKAHLLARANIILATRFCNE